MVDGLDQAQPEPVAPAPVGTKVKAAPPKSGALGGVPAGKAVLLAGAAAVLVWGTWVSKSLHDLHSTSRQIVQVRLQDLVGEYVQSAARSNMPSELAGQQTGAFLNVLNETVKAHTSAGQVVILANAIVAGAVPDITNDVREEVYAKVKKPQVAGPIEVQGQMKQFMAQNAGSASDGK